MFHLILTMQFSAFWVQVNFSQILYVRKTNNGRESELSLERGMRFFRSSIRGKDMLTEMQKTVVRGESYNLHFICQKINENNLLFWIKSSLITIGWRRNMLNLLLKIICYLSEGILGKWAVWSHAADGP